jgi:hypothetical protein
VALGIDARAAAAVDVGVSERYRLCGGDVGASEVEGRAFDLGETGLGAPAAAAAAAAPPVAPTSVGSGSKSEASRVAESLRSADVGNRTDEDCTGRALGLLDVLAAAAAAEAGAAAAAVEAAAELADAADGPRDLSQSRNRERSLGIAGKGPSGRSTGRIPGDAEDEDEDEDDGTTRTGVPSEARPSSCDEPNREAECTEGTLRMLRTLSPAASPPSPLLPPPPPTLLAPVPAPTPALTSK